MTEREQKMSWRRLLKFAIWFAVDTLVCMVPVRRHAKRVLMIRLDNIGDFVLWLDAAQRLAAHFKGPGNEVVLVAPLQWAGWAEELGIFDRVVALDREQCVADPVYRFAAELKIRQLGCATAVVPGYARDWFKGDQILRTCGARERIGSEGDPTAGSQMERRFARGWYTKLLKAKAETLMELERNAEFAGQLIEEEVAARVADLRALISEDRIQAILRRLGLDMLGIEGGYYVLCPGASEAVKCWPVGNFEEIARRIYRETGWTGLVCGGPEDAALGEQLSRVSGVVVQNWAGCTSLTELAALLSGAKLVVANDSAAVHIATALSVSSVCISGGGHVGRFLPYPVVAAENNSLPVTLVHEMDCFGCQWNCIYNVAPGPCVESVAVERVWEAVHGIILRKV